MKNKTKTTLSVLILIVFAIIGGGSFDGDDDSITIIAIMLLVFGIIGIIVSINQAKEKEKTKEKIEKWKEEQKQIALKEKEKLCQEYERQKNAFMEKHGVPDSTVFWKDYDINSEINVYESQKKVIIMGKEYAFKDILSCTFTDNPTTIKGKMTAVSQSKVDNGSTIGRAIVGGVVAGPTGAIIGGTTANRQTQTVYKQENDTTYHNYIVIINVNSISNPIIRIHIGEDGRLTNDIVGLMNVIISRK